MNRLYAAMIALAACLFSSHAAAGGDVAAGKAAVEKYGCAACHGKDFQSPVDPTYPRLAGQNEDYLVHALTAYQRGAEAVNGRVNAIMGAQAKPLTERDIQNVAAYLHSLPGRLVVRD